MAFSATWVSLEGLALAAKAGIDLRTMIDVIRAGGAGNIFTDRMVEASISAPTHPVLPGAGGQGCRAVA
jgi:3-hydroxyisobutyrate dehydrogenase-like beta-hydroxyacid dehydrogenase